MEFSQKAKEVYISTYDEGDAESIALIEKALREAHDAGAAEAYVDAGQISANAQCGCGIEGQCDSCSITSKIFNKAAALTKEK